jgi:hypothetical protein
MWERLKPLIDAERRNRSQFADPVRWQAYFENLYFMIEEGRAADISV